MATEKRSLKVLKDIGKLSNDGILAYDLADESVLYCNKALGKILGLSLEEITDGGLKRLRKTLKDEAAHLIAAYRQFKQSFKISNLELRVVSTKEKYISVDAYMLDLPPVAVAFVKDITAAKAHLNYIVEFGARKNTILDTLTHNLIGPLNLTGTLLDVIDQVSSAQHNRKIDQPTMLIRENTQRCIDLIHSFLSEEHLASPAVPVEASRFDVLAKVRIIAERYAQFNPTKQIRMVSQVKELFVTGDDVKFFQIVNNLVSNSIKFTGEKGKIVIEVNDGSSSFEVVVRDNGIGIPEYFHPRLFEKNTPAARAGLRGEKSTGFGLYIIRKLVELMKGTITFKSEEGKGSVFRVVFPNI